MGSTGLSLGCDWIPATRTRVPVTKRDSTWCTSVPGHEGSHCHGNYHNATGNDDVPCMACNACSLDSHVAQRAKRTHVIRTTAIAHAVHKSLDERFGQRRHLDALGKLHCVATRSRAQTAVPEPVAELKYKRTHATHLSSRSKHTAKYNATHHLLRGGQHSPRNIHSYVLALSEPLCHALPVQLSRLT